MVDGDTVVLSDKDRIRMIGVDTPELHHPTKPVQCFASEAWQYSKAQLENKKVKITFDSSNNTVKHRDKYGRLLAYIYLPDGAFHNQNLIQNGYGFAYTRFPYRYSAQFVKLEEEAHKKALGLWGKCPQPDLLRDVEEHP